MQGLNKKTGILQLLKFDHWLSTTFDPDEEFHSQSTPRTFLFIIDSKETEIDLYTATALYYLLCKTSNSGDWDIFIKLWTFQ